MCPIVLFLLGLLAGVQACELRPQLAAEARGMAMLQQRMMLELVQRHKQIPRVTYFTCRYPANNDTGNVRANRGNRSLQQLRAAFDAKNLQLIESLNEASGAFLRIVLLDVLSQGEARKGGRKGRPKGTRGRAGGATGSGNGGSGVTAFNLQLNADWLDNVMTVEALRQFVVVDLACGMLSRRFLQMVSGTVAR
ncbi:hypothetical protein ACLKA7_017165 [Drosophila subpalustris]